MGSRFIGRAKELATLQEWLGEAQPITLVGTAGIGKSRLAEEVCARWKDETVAAGLANEQDESGCVALLGRALGLPNAGRRAISGALADRGALLLWLDDADHAIEPLAELVVEWQAAAPELRVLVTSRQRLRLRGERTMQLEPLSLEGGADSEACALLDDRLRGHTPAVDLDMDRKMSLLRWVEGIPLAIELAAARAPLLATAHDGEGRLEVLRGGYRDAAQRHSTLERAIAWSWTLLGESEQRMLSETAAFDDSFDVHEAGAIATQATAIGDALQLLVERSFIRLTGTRLRLFDAVREFAREERPEDHRHARTRLARRIANEGSADDADVLGIATQVASPSGEELGLDRDAQVLVRLRACRVLSASGPADQILALTEGVDRSALAADASARLDVARASALRVLGRFEAARELVRATVDGAGSLDPALLGELLLESALASHAQRDLDEAASLYERVLTLAHDDAAVQGRVRANLGAVAHDRGDLDEAERWYEQAMAALGRADQARSLGAVRANLALLQQERGDLVMAEASFARALADLEVSPYLGAIHASNLGTLRLELNEPAAACSLHDAAIQPLRRMGDQRSTVLCLCRRAAARACADALLDAERDLEEAASRAFGSSDPLLDAVVRLHRAWLSVGRARSASGTERTRWLEDARKRMREAGETSLSDDARTARRLLERALGALDGTSLSALPADALLVGIEARCLRLPNGEWSDLRRHASQRRMLEALVGLDPRARLDFGMLQEIAWPGERIRADAARNRIHVTLSKLRKRGLESILCRDDAGYFISPAVRVERVAITEPP